MTTPETRDSYRYIAPELKPFVEVLGEDDTAKVFLELGGSQVYLSTRRPRDGVVTKLLGPDKTRLLAGKLCGGTGGYIKIPLGREWLVNVMARKGMTDNVIARTIRCDVATVRRLVRPQNRQRAPIAKRPTAVMKTTIARELQISVNTVKYALAGKLRPDGKPWVTASTSERIWAAAERLNYRDVERNQVPAQPFQRPPAPMFED